MSSKPGRVMIDWSRTDEHRVAKQLTGIINLYQGIIEKYFGETFSTLYPLITKDVLSRAVTKCDLQVVQNKIKVTSITARKLYNRGDKCIRNGEYDMDFWPQVESSYLKITNEKIKSRPVVLDGPHKGKNPDDYAPYPPPLEKQAPLVSNEAFDACLILSRYISDDNVEGKHAIKVLMKLSLIGGSK